MDAVLVLDDGEITHGLPGLPSTGLATYGGFPREVGVLIWLATS